MTEPVEPNIDLIPNQILIYEANTGKTVRTVLSEKSIGYRRDLENMIRLAERHNAQDPEHPWQVTDYGQIDSEVLRTWP